MLEHMCCLSTLLSCIHNIHNWNLTSTFTAFNGYADKRGPLLSLWFQCVSNVKINDFFPTRPAVYTRHTFGDIKLIYSK